MEMRSDRNLNAFKNSGTPKAIPNGNRASLRALVNPCPTGNLEVTGSISAWSGNILSWTLIMKCFLQSFSFTCWFKKGSCQYGLVLPLRCIPRYTAVYMHVPQYVPWYTALIMIQVFFQIFVDYCKVLHADTCIKFVNIFNIC